MKFITVVVQLIFFGTVLFQNNLPDSGGNMKPKTPLKIEITTLGGGCFWCLEPIYEDLKGVLKVEAGYSGGHIDNPAYKQVIDGSTGHAEVVQITFDPDRIGFSDILDVFFFIHDPTTLNRQGNDVGTQYRSVIFYHNMHQKSVAENVIRKLNQEDIWKAPIVTEVSPFSVFYKAEDYHQAYFENNPSVPYCQFVISPKVKKFNKKYNDMLKK